MQEPRFLTNDQGEPVEVVLDFDTYKKLLGSPTQDPKLLRDLSQEQLEALAESKLTTDTQAQLRSLIQREKVGVITPEETAILDHLMHQLDQLDILKARALYTLHKLQSHPSVITQS